MRANTDLSEGRYALFMDEQISFDAVSSILHSDGAENLVNNVVFGDQRYGRIMYLFASIVSYLPERLFNQKGQIIATRMGQTLLLLMSVLILSHLLNVPIILKATAFLTLISAPYISYFSSMPKPEPIQLLLICVFLTIRTRNRFIPLAYLFLGLSFGAKISVLPAVIFAFFIDTYLEWHHTSHIKLFLKRFGGFVAGWLLAVPVLFFPGGLHLYLENTFRNITHGSDNSQIGFTEWLDFYANSFFHGYRYFFIALLLVLFAIFIAFSKAGKSTDKISLWGDFRATVENNILFLYLLGFAISLLLPIFMRIKRLWGFYVFEGHLFAVTLIFLSVDLIIKGTPFLNSKKKFIYILVSLFLAIRAMLFFSNTANEFDQLAKRTSTTEYLQKKSIYDQMVPFLEKKAIEKSRRVSIYLDPNLFWPDNTSRYSLQPFWGPFLYWTAPDFDILLVTNASCSEPDGKMPPKTSTEFNDCLKSRELGQKALDTKRFRLNSSTINGINIYERIQDPK